ncbi:MAG: BON domain-containing protein [Anaerolineae bacterium]|nr:BON domain-containing protein [Anaerolineae bacterium]
MTDTTLLMIRDDTDIHADIDHLVAHYPPLAKDRHAFKVAVDHGAVTLSGHVQSVITRRYLMDHVGDVEGVTSVDASDFFDDVTIKLEVSHVLPLGVKANVLYGTVILTGEPPQDSSVEQLADHILELPGVARVANGFGG